MHVFQRMLVSMALGFALALAGCGASPPIEPHHMLTHSYTVRDAQFGRVMSDLMGPAIVTGNAIETFPNGDAFYPAQLDAIRSATQSITFETYLYWASDIGQQFADALAERARAGVKVHVTIDSIGSNGIAKEYLELLEESGATVIKYNPIHRIALLITVGEVTQRTHRKLLIVDGKLGFIGGAGIADFWKGDARNENEWRDTMYRATGPVVAHLQAAFVDNWIQSTGQLLDGPEYFPKLSEAGDVPAQVFQSSPGGGSASMELMYLIAITAAEKSIDIATPYFVPDDLIIDAMREALARGVRIRLIIPGPFVDYEMTKVASRSTWRPLLEAGLELYEFQPSMYHNKAMVVDGYWTSIGSANLDPLSFRLNDEANLNVYDEAFAQAQTSLLEADIARSNRLTEVEHNNRSWTARILEFLTWPIKPVM